MQSFEVSTEQAVPMAADLLPRMQVALAAVLPPGLVGIVVPDLYADGLEVARAQDARRLRFEAHEAGVARVVLFREREARGATLRAECDLLLTVDKMRWAVR